MRMRSIGTGLVMFVLSTACASTATEAPAPQDEKVAAVAPTPQRDDDCPLVAGTGPRLTLVDNWFGPDCLTVRADAVLQVQNLGKYEHSFTISEESFGTKPFVVDVNLPGGNTKPKAVPLDGVLDAGTYDFYCTFHGSMDGVLEVIEPSV